MNENLPKKNAQQRVDAFIKLHGAEHLTSLKAAATKSAGMSKIKRFRNCEKDRVMEQGGKWIWEHKFWLFGTLKFKDGFKIFDAVAKRDARHFFNKLDRAVLCRGEVENGLRLRRLVFLEHGPSGENTHVHFFIKGNKFGHYRKIMNEAQRIWCDGKIDRARDILVSDNLSNDRARAFYCFKESTGFLGASLVDIKDNSSCDTLLSECCYLY